MTQQYLRCLLIIIAILSFVPAGCGGEVERFACISKQWVVDDWSWKCIQEAMNEDEPCECGTQPTDKISCQYSLSSTCEAHGFTKDPTSKSRVWGGNSGYDKSTFSPNLSAGQKYPGKSGGGGHLLTCDGKSSVGVCIHYTFSSQSDRDSFAAQCSYRTSNSHSCPSGGVGCRHTTSTRTSDTYTYGQSASSVKSKCTQTGGTPL